MEKSVKPESTVYLYHKITIAQFRFPCKLCIILLRHTQFPRFQLFNAAIRLDNHPDTFSQNFIPYPTVQTVAFIIICHNTLRKSVRGQTYLSSQIRNNSPLIIYSDIRGCWFVRNSDTAIQPQQPALPPSVIGTSIVYSFSLHFYIHSQRLFGSILRFQGYHSRINTFGIIRNL